MGTEGVTMTAFSNDALKTEDRSPNPLLIIGPRVVVRQTPDDSVQGYLNTSVAEMVAANVAREQQNLAMLQRALVRCGLISVKRNKEA